MEGVGGGEAAAADAALLQPVGEAADRLRRPGENRGARPVDRGDLHALGEGARRLGLGHHHGEHGARGAGLHQRAAGRRQPRGVFEREDAGEGRRDVFPEAVADQRRGSEPARLPHPGERVFEGEERGLGDARRVDRPPCPRLGVEEQRRQAEVGRHVGEAGVERRAEGGLVGEAAGHARVLGALAWKEEDRARARGGAPGLGGAAQEGGGLGASGGDDCEPFGMGAPAGLEGEGRVREAGGVVALQRPGERGPGRRQRLGRPGGEGEEAGPPGVGERGRSGRLLDHQMGVGPADAEGADRGAAGAVRVARPGAALGQRAEGPEGAGGVRGGEVREARQVGVAEREQDLDEARESRGRVEVPDVALDRAEVAGPPRRGEARAIGLVQGRHLDRVAKRGAGAVGLDIVDRLRLHPGRGQGRGEDRGLARDAGRGQADLVAAVVVDGRAEDHAVDRVAVGARVRKALEGEHRHAVGEDRSGGLGVEGPAEAIGGGDALLLAQVAFRSRLGDRRRPGEGEVAVAEPEPAGRFVNGDEAGRAGGLHPDAGAAQVEVERGPRGDHAAEVADGRLERVRAGGQAAQPAAGRRAGVDADPGGAAGRVAAGVLQRMLGAFEEEALLWVHQLGLAGGVAEAGGVEAVGLGGPAPDRHVVGIRGALERRAGRGELLRGHRPQAGAAGREQVPEGGGVVGAGQAGGEADDGDGVVGPVVEGDALIGEGGVGDGGE